MDFGAVLRSSWDIIWKNRALWIFGILASCGSGGMNLGGTSNFRMDNRVNTFFDTERMQSEFQTFLENGGWAIILGIICAALLIGLLLWVIGIFGKVSLIKGILKANAGSAVSFGSTAREGWSMLGSALGLNFLLILIPIAALILLAVAAIPIGLVTLGIGLICLLCLLIPLGIAFGVFTQLANISLVREQRGVGAALSNAWQLITTQFAPLVAMAIVLVVGGLVVGAILLLPMFAIALPAIISFARDPETAGTGLLTSGILFVVLLPFYLAASGIIQGYIHSAWTLTYLQLTPTAAPAKSTRAKTKK